MEASMDAADDGWCLFSSQLLPELIQGVAMAAGDYSTLMAMKLVCSSWHGALSEDGFWALLTKQRFGPEHTEVILPTRDNPTHDAWGPWQYTYRRLLSAWYTNALSDEFTSDVTWGNDTRYFQRVHQLPGSFSPTCLRLSSVCWLHAATSFTGVCPGRYVLTWHLQVGEHVGSLEHVMLDAYVAAARGVHGEALPVQPAPGLGKSQSMLQAYRTLEVQGAVEEGQVPTLMVQLPQATTGGSASEGGGRAGDVPRVSMRATAPHALAQDGTFFKLQLPALQLLLLAREAPHRWVNIQLGLEVPRGAAEYDVTARLWNVNEWWKYGLTFDTVSLQLASPGMEDSPAAAAAAAWPITSAGQGHGRRAAMGEYGRRGAMRTRVMSGGAAYRGRSGRGNVTRQEGWSVQRVLNGLRSTGAQLQNTLQQLWQ